MEDDIKQFIDFKRNTEEFYLVLRYKQGHCPGTFYRKLFELIEMADYDNYSKLNKVFPLIATCLHIYRKTSVEEIVNYLRGSNEN